MNYDFVSALQLLEKALEFSMSDDVRAQDTVFIISSVSNSRQGRELGWDFVKKRWSELSERYQGSFLFNRLVKLSENFASLEKAKEVDEFFKSHQSQTAERTIQQCVESIQLNAAWLSRDLNSIKRFFSENTA